MTETLVVDYAWSHPSLSALKNVGYSGICRYLSTDPTKNITAAEAAAAHALGLSVTLIWETSANRALSGANAGGADGVLASHQATALGFPAGLPIYAAVDFGASSAQLAVIGAYLTAFGKATGRPVGVYGSALVVAQMLKTGIASFGWQTAAWSGGVVLSTAHLYQRTQKTVGIVSGSYDENVALKPNWGQWVAGSAPILTPTSGTTTTPTSGGSMTGADATYLWGYYTHNGKNVAQVIFDTYDAVVAIGGAPTSTSTPAVQPVSGPVTLSDADKDDIAQRVANLLAARLQS